MATISRNEDVVTIATGERIDTINAVEFEKEITPILSEAGLKIIFDCTNLDYISSSGLRVILKAQKMVSAGKGDWRETSHQESIRYDGLYTLPDDRVNDF